MRRQCKVEQCLDGDGQRYGSGCGQKPKLKYIFGQRRGAHHSVTCSGTLVLFATLLALGVCIRFPFNGGTLY